MDTTEFLNLINNKDSKEKVLTALEKVLVELIARINEKRINSAYDALRVVAHFVVDAYHDYDNAANAYFKAAEQVLNSTKEDVNDLKIEEILL